MFVSGSYNYECGLGGQTEGRKYLNNHNLTYRVISAKERILNDMRQGSILSSFEALYYKSGTQILR